MLLEHAGQVVRREELQKRLWPADTFVDFDHGLNKAINKIREALGDSAESPRFVETVARRGYRFVADVRVADPAPCSQPGARTSASVPRQTLADRQDPAGTLAMLTHRLTPRAWTISAFVLLVAAGLPRLLEASVPATSVAGHSLPGCPSVGKPLERCVPGLLR